MAADDRSLSMIQALGALGGGFLQLKNQPSIGEAVHLGWEGVFRKGPASGGNRDKLDNPQCADWPIGHIAAGHFDVKFLISKGRYELKIR